MPVPPTTVPPAPQGRTARRLSWAHLPPSVRAEVERRLGSEVVSAQSQDAGFTPGLASILTCADGSSVFLKAASLVAQRAFAESYHEEAQKLSFLPDGVPAPRLLWTFTRADWVVLGLEHVVGRMPQRPWDDDELDQCLELLTQVADSLTPAPPGPWSTFAEETAAWPACWEHVAAHHRHLVGPYAEEAAALARAAADASAGDTVVHCDVRDDNLLLADDGRVLLCDWNWPVVGARWVDALLLLVIARGDGVDTERIVASHRLFSDADADAVDAVLALATGYFLRSSDHPAPTSSPFVRDHQLWCGEVAWDWLATRRGWR